MKYLFIGGPEDGHWIEVSDTRRGSIQISYQDRRESVDHEFDPDSCVMVRTYTYLPWIHRIPRRFDRGWRDPMHQHWETTLMFRLEGLSETEAFKILLGGYRNGKPCARCGFDEASARRCERARYEG